MGILNSNFFAYCRVRDVQGAKQSGLGRIERQRSPEQPGPQGNAHALLPQTIESLLLFVGRTGRRTAIVIVVW